MALKRSESVGDITELNAMITSNFTPVSLTSSLNVSMNSSAGRSGNIRKSISANAYGGMTFILDDPPILVIEQVSLVSA